MKTRCPRGHTVSRNTSYCGWCGGRMIAVKSAGTAEPTIRKIAGASAVKLRKDPYLYAWQRGDLFDCDPTVRELAWQAAYGGLAKGR